MKIGKLIIENITSYKQRTEFLSDKQINILIGPNEGGKSNLQLILAVILTKCFIQQYQIRKVEDKSKLEIDNALNKKAVTRILNKFVGNDVAQEIEIEMIPERFDIENIKAIGNNLEKLNAHLSVFEKKYESYSPFEFVDSFANAKSFTYRISNLELQPVQAHTAPWAFLEYLQTVFVFMRVVSNVPEVSLSSPVFFFFIGKSSNEELRHSGRQLD